MMKKLVILTLLLFLSISLTGCNNDDPKVCEEGYELIGSECIIVCEEGYELVDGECVDPDAIDEDIYFALIGPDELTFEVGQAYSEKGFIAKDGKEYIGESNVTVTGDLIVNSSLEFIQEGTFYVTYTLNYNDEEIVLIRTINVVQAVTELNENCTEVEDTNLLFCEKIWTQYLHTVVKVRLYIDKESTVDSLEVFDHIENEIAYYNIFSDKYTEYEGVTNIWTINQNPSETHVIPENLFNMIEFTLEHQQDVDNLFNAALGPVLQVWHDYREECNTGGTCAVPPMEDLLAQNAYTDPSNIVLDRENLTITMQEHMSLDLGGVSKGYISGIITEYLDSLGIHGYLLNNGESNISIGGLHPTRETGEFILAVTDPTNPFTYYATVNLRDGDQLVTSGDYQQNYWVGEAFYHHIIHNETLMPERYNRSVSIVTSDPALADLYSTAIFLMPTSDGIEFVNSIDGLEGIWYDIDGVIHYSDNFEADYLRDVIE